MDDSLLLIHEAFDDLGIQGAPIELKGLIGLGDNETGVEAAERCHSGQRASRRGSGIEDFIRGRARMPRFARRCRMLRGEISR